MTTDELRAKFEAFFSDCNLRRLNMRSDCYEDARIALLWEGWQAAYDSRDAEVEALRKDAERINWLALHPRGAKITIEGMPQDCIFWGISSAPNNTLREVIDAAMREESK